MNIRDVPPRTTMTMGQRIEARHQLQYAAEACQRLRNALHDTGLAVVRYQQFADDVEKALLPLQRLRDQARQAAGERKFPLGLVVTTPAAAELLAANGTEPAALLDRHVRGDWGNIPLTDAQLNERGVQEGGRIHSAYDFGSRSVWVITDADRAVTTLILSTEY